MKNLNKYYLTTGLMALILSPLAFSVGLIGAMLVFPPVLALVIVWFSYTKNASLPENASEVIMPIILAFCYYMCVWIVVFGISDYRYDSDLFLGGTYFFLTIPYFMINLFFAIMGNPSIFPLLNVAITVITVLTIVITGVAYHKRIVYDKKIVVYGVVFICLTGIAAFQHYDRNEKILARDYQVERVEDEVNLNEYRPFNSSEWPENKLKRLNEPASISFTDNYPRLDGATAAYPVYAAMVQELYKGLDETTVREYVTCSKTDNAYKRLTDGEIDIFFGAQPSVRQVEAAKSKDLELILTPIAKEAFVFLVNSDNPVDSLTISQIQDIYQKKIVNWRELGGNNEKIMPFQRPVDSGSQTIMLAMVMKDKALPTPLWEEESTGMGGIISSVAQYRNYSSAIGYSFRYFATGLKPNDNIKLLAINGIAPTIENISNGAYPFTIDVYAVTAGSTNENTDILISWILSEQGQRFIETCGYISKSR